MKKANVWKNLLDVGREGEKIALIFRIFPHISNFGDDSFGKCDRISAMSEKMAIFLFGIVGVAMSAMLGTMLKFAWDAREDVGVIQARIVSIRSDIDDLESRIKALELDRGGKFAMAVAKKRGQYGSVSLSDYVDSFERAGFSFAPEEVRAILHRLAEEGQLTFTSVGEGFWAIQ